MILPTIDPAIAAGVVLSTAATDAVYVFFTASVASRRRMAAASWSSVWYLLSAFAVISYTSNWAYVLFAALGSWIGGFLSITALDRAPTQARLTRNAVCGRRISNGRSMTSARRDAPKSARMPSTSARLKRVGPYRLIGAICAQRSVGKSR